MGRKRRNGIYPYFQYNEETNSSKCSMPGCGQILRGKHGANLLRHFYTQHRLEYNKISEVNSANRNTGPPRANENSNIKLSLVMKNCIDLVTIHGRPFTLVEDEAFKNLIKLIPDLTERDQNSVNVKKIKACIQEKAYEVRTSIFKEVENKLIELKVDVASVKSRRFFGVNIQYILEDKIVLRNLSVLELHHRNTAEFLKEAITTILSRYGIELKQLYSITSDNGANMLSMSRQMDEGLQQTYNALQSQDDSLDETDESVMLMQDDDYSQFIDDIEFQGNTAVNMPPKITTVRCAAHTLQLAVRDACQERQPVFNRCRIVARALRTPNISLQLRENNLVQALIDCPTRWDSTADMLERLLTLKHFCQSNINSALHLDNNTWSEIEDSLMSLAPCRVLSKKLQKEQLTFGDFYIAWTRCLLDIESIGTPFSMFLAICIRERQNTLFENDCFISCLYLDPRVNVVLTAEQLQKARDCLVRTYQRLVQLASPLTEISVTNNNNEPVAGPSTNNDDESVAGPSTNNDNESVAGPSTNNDDESVAGPSTNNNNESVAGPSTINAVDVFLQNFMERRQQDIPGISSSLLRLQNNLIDFLNEPLLPSNTNILTYWAKKKISDPQLYLLSNEVMASPPTQVSVERLFSSLKFVLDNLRLSLKDSIIDDILIIRNNYLYNK